MCIIVIYNHRYKPVGVFFYYYFYFSTLLGHWDFREYYVLKHEGSGISNFLFFFRSTRTAKTRTTIIERNTRRRPPATTAPQCAPSLQGVDKSDVSQRFSWNYIKKTPRLVRGFLVRHILNGSKKLYSAERSLSICTVY